MLRNFRERFAELFQRLDGPPPLNEASTLHEIALQHSQIFEFIERKYGVKADVEDKTLPLSAFVEKYGLPPAPIVFMEVQMGSRAPALRTLSAREAEAWLLKIQTARVLDVREEWEASYGRLPGSQALKPELLDEILNQWSRETPILVYCHYGIRSLDAATYLTDRGFSEVYVLQGGIEAWSRDVDPSVPLYESAYC